MQQDETRGVFPGRDRYLAAVFRDKPEMVIDLPGEMLSAADIAGYRKIKHLAIVEIAGRDSVAAAIRAVETSGYTDLLPVYAYTGSEIGAWESVPRAVDCLARRLPETRVHPLLLVGSPDVWCALNGRFISEIIARFAAYTPCTGCHLYLHAVRVPLAKELGGVPIIAGERESHSGAVKVNQLGAALDIYQQFLAEFGIRLELPLRHVASGAQIEEILGMSWPRGKQQLGCCLSGNYRKTDDSVGMTEESAARFLRRFCVASARRMLSHYIEGKTPDPMAIAKQVIQAC